MYVYKAAINSLLTPLYNAVPEGILQLQPEVHMPFRPICWGSQRVRQGARGRASVSADTVNM